LIAVGAAFFQASRLVGQAAPLHVVPGLSAVDALVSAEFAKDSVGSITAGIVRGGELVWTASHGFANAGTRKPADRETVYRIGSITKMFTATMLLQLVEAGQLRFSDPVARFYPDIGLARNGTSRASAVTFLQLATMTSGLAAEPGEASFDSGPLTEWEKILGQAVSQTEFTFEPGIHFAYSNIGYAVLGAALGRAAHVPYIEWQQKHIFDPLGMRHTGFELGAAIAGALAVGYVVSDGRVDSTVPTREALAGRGYRVPNGGIFTTIDDLSRFLAFELGNGPEAVLSHARLSGVYTGMIATSADEDFGYGVGFMLQHCDDFPWLGHSGGMPGYQAVMYFDRDHQLGVILLRSATGGKASIGRLAPEMLKTLILAKLAAEKLPPEGRYF
jgi:CubicO group peptidase (beta-lactamase class C family)